MEYLSFCAFGAIAESIWILCTRLQNSAAMLSATFTCVLLKEGRELDVLVVKLCDVVFGNYWYWLRRRLAGEAAAEGIGLAPAPGCLHIWKLTTLVQSTVKC